MSPLRIDSVESEGALLALEPEWNVLLGRSASDSVFLCFEWVSTWWATFGAPFRPLVLTARDEDGALVGVAPLMVGPAGGRFRRRLRHLMLIGQQGETLAEHLDVFVASGREGDATPCLVEAMLERRRRWDWLLFERVPATSPNLGALEQGLGDAGLRPERRTASGSPYLPLPASFDELLRSKSRNFRRQWNNSLNRLAREGDVRVRLAGTDIDLDEAFDHLVSLHRTRWGPSEGSFRTEAYVEFHRALSRKMAATDGLLLALLEVGGRFVAARYDFVHADKVWCFQSGWLPDHERMRVGTILLGKVLETAIDRGLREYDFLSGEDSYKYRWATAERELVDVEACTGAVGVRLYRAARGAKRALANLRGRGRG